MLAIMFSKLRMSVADATKEFREICFNVYVDGLSPAKRTYKLRHHIEELLTRNGLPIDLKLGKDSRHPEDGCPWYVHEA
jgi:hypothetical protein